MLALILTLTALMLFVVKPAETAELRPFSDALSGEQSGDPVMLNYAFVRCSALYTKLAAASLHEDPKNSENSKRPHRRY